MFFIMLAIVAVSFYNCYVYCNLLGRVVLQGWGAIEKALRKEVKEGRLTVHSKSDQWINLLCFREMKQIRQHGLFKSLAWNWVLKPRVKAYMKAVPYLVIGFAGWLALIAWSLLASYNLWAVVMQAAYAYCMGGVA